ncbi:Rpa-interacting protein a [Thalictrum thalictroides]|uniref:Rpa-interacting protein a n=1 Tax=Thalictrum thalictroides TaxID=46969 RepID=A0A7J6V0R1_THATH|nr:Rpa-interacting protein a [Thalictrum thalictroides]
MRYHRPISQCTTHSHMKIINKVRINIMKRKVKYVVGHLTGNKTQPSAAAVVGSDFMDVTFRDIVSDELNKLKNTDTDVDIWDYHAFQTHTDTECQDILIEMQRIFYEDLTASQYTTTEQDDYEGTWEEEDDYLAKVTLEQLQLKTDQICNKEVWCPICKQGELKEDHRLIYCTRCKLQLSRGDEVNVEILRARLAEAHSDHLERGCMLAPKFCMETRFNLTALYIQCEACSIFEIVL